MVSSQQDRGHRPDQGQQTLHRRQRAEQGQRQGEGEDVVLDRGVPQPGYEAQAWYTGAEQRELSRPTREASLSKQRMVRLYEKTNSAPTPNWRICTSFVISQRRG